MKTQSIILGCLITLSALTHAFAAEGGYRLVNGRRVPASDCTSIAGAIGTFYPTGIMVAWPDEKSRVFIRMSRTAMEDIRTGQWIKLEGLKDGYYDSPSTDGGMIRVTAYDRADPLQ